VEGDILISIAASQEKQRTRVLMMMKKLAIELQLGKVEKHLLICIRAGGLKAPWSTVLSGERNALETVLLQRVPHVGALKALALSMVMVQLGREITCVFGKRFRSTFRMAI
jgi:hypothetical protein